MHKKSYKDDPEKFTKQLQRFRNHVSRFINPSRLFAALSVSEPLSVAFKKALEREVIPLTLPKNHILLEAPKISSHFYFLDSGFAMSYTFHDGRKITEDFRRAGQVMVACKSFFEQGLRWSLYTSKKIVPMLQFVPCSQFQLLRRAILP